jgi:hypothetical protein
MGVKSNVYMSQLILDSRSQFYSLSDAAYRGYLENSKYIET